MSYFNEKLNEFNNNIKGKKIAIIGLGVSNIPLIEYFYKYEAKVTVFDNTKELEKNLIEKLEKYNIKYFLGKDSLKNLIGFDYIFRSPSCMPTIKEIEEEVKRGAIVTSEIEKVLELTPATVIGITGSDGKTTTTTLIYEILKANGYNCFLGGNIGTPLFTKIEEMKPEDIVILELSSFQLISMKKSPKISVVTNITPNHLNVHKDYQEYIDSKKNIFLNQDKNGLLVINEDNEITREFRKLAKGKVKSFSSKKEVENGVCFDREDGYIKLYENSESTNLINKKEIKLRGIHNCENIAAAICATKDITKENINKKAIAEFFGVEHRIEYITTINDIQWYNDSIASSPTRTIAGLNSFDEKIVLIAGGYDKHLDYNPIAKPIIENVSKLILIGQTAEKIERVVKDELKKAKVDIPIYKCNTLEETVLKAKEVAKKGEVVLFSPASASFDMFKNFEERGRKFKELVLGMRQ